MFVRLSVSPSVCQKKTASKNQSFNLHFATFKPLSLLILTGKCGILKTPLQRIVTGCLVCGLAFVVSGVLELQLKEGYPELPKDDQFKLLVHNGLDCPITIDNEVLGLKSVLQNEYFTKPLSRVDIKS